MAIQVIQPSDPWQMLGQSLGTGLGGGLAELAQQKANELALRQLQMTPQQASAISQLSPELQQPAFKQLLQAPQQQAYLEGLNQLLGGTPSGQMGLQALPEAPSTHAPSSQPFLKPGLNEKQATQLTKLGLQQQETNRKEQARVDKETLPFYHDTLKSAEASKKGLIRLDKMEKLVKEGSLPFSAAYKLFKNLSETDIKTGIPVIGGLIDIVATPVVRALGEGGSLIQKNITSRDLEEFEKLSADFIKDAKDFFGSRVTDADLKAFLNTVPTLLQTDAGKLRVMQNLRDMYDLSIKRSDIMKKIIDDNGGKRPANIEIMVDDLLSPEIDRISSEFKPR